MSPVEAQLGSLLQYISSTCLQLQDGMHQIRHAGHMLHRITSSSLHGSSDSRIHNAVSSTQFTGMTPVWMKTFGEYCSTAPTSLVTGKRTDSSNATPELCHVEKKLVVFLQEPNPEEKIKSGKMKEMTGNDSMYVRQLFKSGKTMVLKAKIVIVCNNIIDIPGMDAAIRRRIIVLPFISTFLDSAEYKAQQEKGTLEPNTNIIDLSVEKELMKYKNAFMYILCRRYRQWVHDENMQLNVPDVIKNVTDNYITYHNYPLRFIKKFMHHVNGSTVAASDIYELFKEWFRKSYPGKKVHDFEKFTREMSNEGYLDDGDGTINDVFVSYNGEYMN